MLPNHLLQHGLSVIGLCGVLAITGCGTADNDFDPFSDNVDEDDQELNIRYANQHEADAVVEFDKAFPAGMQNGSGKIYKGAQLKVILDDEEAWQRAGMPAETFMGMSVPGRSDRELLIASLGPITQERRDRCSQSGRCKPTLEKRDEGFNMAYGYHCGAKWGSGTTSVYDDVDACCFYHDSNCWNISRGNDLGGLGCSNSVNFISCVEQVNPMSTETAEAKRFILNSLLRVAADICELRPTWAFWPRGWLYPLYEPNKSPLSRCQGSISASIAVSTGGAALGSQTSRTSASLPTK